MYEKGGTLKGFFFVFFYLIDDLCTTLIHQLKLYLRKAKPTGIKLGSGTYGKVIELTSAGELVAGKVLKTSFTIYTIK